MVKGRALINVECVKLSIFYQFRYVHGHGENFEFLDNQQTARALGNRREFVRF